MPRVAAGVPGEAELVARFRIDLGDYVTAAEIARQGSLAVVGLGDGNVVGVELQSGRVLFRERAHPAGVLGVSLSPEGTHFASCGQEDRAKIWSANGELLHELPGGSADWVEHVAWAPAGDRLAIAAGRKVRVWTGHGEPLLETEPMASTVSALAWRFDGSAIAASCYGGVHVWPFVHGAKARHFAWKGSLISLAWSPDAKVIACGSQDSSVHFWRLANGQDSQMSGYPSKPKALAWDRQSKLLATSGDASATVWDFRGKGPEGTQPIALDAHEGVVTRLAFSPTRDVLASGSQDSSLLLWEPRRAKQPTRYAFMDAEVTALSWHPEHHGLLSGDAHGHLCFWQTS